MKKILIPALLLTVSALGWWMLRPEADSITVPLSQSVPESASENQDNADYATQINQLQHQGVSAETIQNRVLSQIAAEGRRKRDNLQKTGLSGKDLKKELHKIDQEQGALVDHLFGSSLKAVSETASPTDSPNSEVVATGNTHSASPIETRNVNNNTQPTATIPLVLVTPDASVNLSPQELKAVEALKTDFITSIGGPNQNASDPEYLIKWNEAQPVIDERFRLLFGDDAYIKMTEKAHTKGAN
jgi:hypothetical protein